MPTSRRLRQDARGGPGRGRRLSRASSATSRPTSRSGSARCSPDRARASSCASSATTSQARPARGRRRRRTIGSVPGVIEEHVELQKECPRSRSARSRQAAQYGLKPGDVRRAAAHRASPARRSADIFRAARPTTCRSGALPETRNSLTAIRDLPIDTPAGGLVTLDEVAEVASRRARTRSTARTCRASSRSAPTSEAGDLGAVAEDIEDQLEDMKLPPGYRAELLGEYKERQSREHAVLFGLAAPSASSSC